MESLKQRQTMVIFRIAIALGDSYMTIATITGVAWLACSLAIGTTHEKGLVCWCGGHSRPLVPSLCRFPVGSIGALGSSLCNGPFVRFGSGGPAIREGGSHCKSHPGQQGPSGARTVSQNRLHGTRPDVGLKKAGLSHDRPTAPIPCDIQHHNIMYSVPRPAHNVPKN